MSTRDVATEYQAIGRRILSRLAEAGVRGERRGELLVLLKGDPGVSLASGFPSGALAPLIEAGAVRCAVMKGRTVFVITDAGRARLAREEAEAEPFAAQHRQIVERVTDVEGAKETIRVNIADDVLETFRRRRIMSWLVGEPELEAGARLQRDFVLAQTAPQVTANWSRLVVDGAGYRAGLSKGEVAIEAGRRVDKALRAVGPDFSGILVDALAFSKGIEIIEQEYTLPARSGKVLLAFALRGLARHYGLSDVARGMKARMIRHWGAENYRPDLRVG
ncbi:MAG TPA: DUF6456 domain-containing protein [Rhabdaerophilum sp.]|nr:DUF6456 domain-containing protein [Rhabdaerophilum sp.]